MSEFHAGQRVWRFYIDDMIRFAERIQACTEGLEQRGFLSDGLTHDATLRNLELIGEAATHVPQEIYAAHPEVPWRRIIATRNRLIHGYLGIDDDTIWNIIIEDIPALLPMLEKIPAYGAGK